MREFAKSTEMLFHAKCGMWTYRVTAAE